MTIIFYDIPSTFTNGAWSVNTWKARYCLNYKGLEYHTEWVEYPDIEEHCKKLGIPPTSERDGSPLYTFPSIHDTMTNSYVSDSFAIAEYLDRTYPATPTIIPDGTAGFQAAFEGALHANIGPLWPFILPTVCVKLNPSSSAYFRRVREKVYGKKMEDLTPKGEERVKEWGKVVAGLEKLESWYAKSEGKGLFLLGETISWADIVVAAHAKFIVVVLGANGEIWKDIEAGKGARWRAAVSSLENYANVV